MRAVVVVVAMALPVGTTKSHRVFGGDGFLSLTHATPVSSHGSDPLTTRGYLAAVIDERGIRRGDAVAVCRRRSWSTSRPVGSL
jgi:hypothetical protein